MDNWENLFNYLIEQWLKIISDLEEKNFEVISTAYILTLRSKSDENIK